MPSSNQHHCGREACRFRYPRSVRIAKRQIERVPRVLFGSYPETYLDVIAELEEFRVAGVESV